jgi:DNA polymerase III subunit beta
MLLNIDTNALAGALKTAGKDDVRYYLNGVCFEPDSGTIVATNGHILFAARGAIDTDPSSCGEPENESDGASVPTFVLPREACAAMVKFAKDCKMTGLALVATLGSDKIVSVRFGNSTNRQTHAAIDGKFPDWRRIVPVKLSGEPGQYNVELLATVHEALALASGARGKRGSPIMAIGYNGPRDPAVLYLPNWGNLLAICMPMRCDTLQAQPDCLSVAHPAESAREAA